MSEIEPGKIIIILMSLFYLLLTIFLVLKFIRYREITTDEALEIIKEKPVPANGLIVPCGDCCIANACDKPGKLTSIVIGCKGFIEE